MNISNWLQKERLKLAWALLPADKKAAAQPSIDAAHEQLRTYLATGKAPYDPSVPHHLVLANNGRRRRHGCGLARIAARSH